MSWKEHFLTLLYVCSVCLFLLSISVFKRLFPELKKNFMFQFGNVCFSLKKENQKTNHAKYTQTTNQYQPIFSTCQVKNSMSEFRKNSNQFLLKTMKASMAYLIQFRSYRVKTLRAHNSRHTFSTQNVIGGVAIKRKENFIYFHDF